ncbi:MAG: serine hydrolase [Acidimicrobiales bacterium]
MQRGGESTEAGDSAKMQQALDDELNRFVDDDPGRSVAVRILDEPAVSLSVAADVVRPAGSFVKLLPAIALYRAAHAGDVDLDATVRRDDLGTTMYPSILEVFAADRWLTLREVAAFSLITSDNPAAEHILGVVGPERIEEVGRELGLDHTHVSIGFRDDDLGDAGRANTTTAHEALWLVEHIETMPELAELRRFLINNQRNTRIPVRLADEIPVMHKTGSLANVANDAGVIYHPAGRVAVAYLCDRQGDPTLTSVEIGDSALRVTEIIADLR